MKIDEAIKILTILSRKGQYKPGIDSINAVKMGSEALKRLQSTREQISDPHWCPLPSETPELNVA